MALRTPIRLPNGLPGVRRVRRAAAETAAAVRGFWCSLSTQGKRFVSNACIAVAVLIAIGLLDQSHWLLRLENGAMDTMMELNKGLDRMTDSSGQEPLLFTFLDIDDASYRQWGEPYHTPRDKIQQLIEFARTSGAAVIVVDIDLSRRGLNPEHDVALAEYLEGYPSDSSPLILVRSFFAESGDYADWREIRPSFLDDYELPGSVHWAQPLFQATLWDGVVRHWHLARYGCLDDQPMLVPSIQLTAAALLSDKYGPDRSVDIETIRLGNCADGAHRSDRAGPTEEIGQKLLYTIPWQEPAPDLVTIPAIAITEADGRLADDLVRDRVVVVGASFAEARDTHRTPIGTMPGAMVVINAIKSLLAFGQLKEPKLWVSLLVQLGVVLLAAWAFSRFNSFVAVGVAATIIFVVLIPLSFYFLKYGMWVEYSIPILALVIHRGISEYRDVRRRIREYEVARQETP